MRLKIDGNKLIKIVGESQSCMVSKLPMTTQLHAVGRTAGGAEMQINAAPCTALKLRCRCWPRPHRPAPPAAVSLPSPPLKKTDQGQSIDDRWWLG